MVTIHNYKEIFPEQFTKIKAKFLKVAGKKLDIHHIGSTAIPGVVGKGIIDILIGVRNWDEAETLVDRLKNSGFTHIHPKEQGRIFLSNIKDTRLGDVHVHITIKGGRQYNDPIAFRDYLRKHGAERLRYSRLKEKAVKEAKSERKKYGALKSAYIKEVMAKIHKTGLWTKNKH